MNTKEKILAFLTRRRSATGGELREHLQLTRQAMSIHLRDLLAAHKVIRTGTTKGALYSLRGRAPRARLFTRILAIQGLEEERVWSQLDAQMGLTRTLRPNVAAITHYAFTEMLNNAIEHSQSEHCTIRVSLTASLMNFDIRDGGIGIFHSIASKQHLPDEDAAMIELLKGKTTTMPEAHSGEGVFFTSRVADEFLIRSHRTRIEWKRAKHDVFVSHQRFLAGTEVRFALHRSARHKLEDVFGEFAPAHYDFQFQKTHVLVKLLQLDYISRSEARRLLANLEKFREIVLDFRDVRSVGQGFADEVFRVFAGRHPQIVIRPDNVSPTVLAMIKHVQRTATASHHRQ